MISEVALQEFRELYMEEFGQEISEEEATELGTNLLSVMDKVYRPLKKEWVETSEKINNIQIKQNESRIGNEPPEERPSIQS